MICGERDEEWLTSELASEAPCKDFQHRKCTENFLFFFFPAMEPFHNEVMVTAVGGSFDT